MFMGVWSISVVLECLSDIIDASLSEIFCCAVVGLALFVSEFIVASLSSICLCDAGAESIEESSCDNGCAVMAILFFGLDDESSDSRCAHVLVFFCVSGCCLVFVAVSATSSSSLVLDSCPASEAVSVVSLSFLLTDLRNESSESLCDHVRVACFAKSNIFLNLFAFLPFSCSFLSSMGSVCCRAT